MTVADLDTRVTRREMTGWIAYYTYERHEQERAERQAERQRKAAK